MGNNGTTWSALSGPANGMDNKIVALAVYNDGSGAALYAGGDFTTAGGVTANRIAKWNGTRWSALDSTYRSLTALTASGRDVYGAGTFAAADGTQSNYVVKWNGSGWFIQTSETSLPYLSSKPLTVGSDRLQNGH